VLTQGVGDFVDGRDLAPLVEAALLEGRFVSVKSQVVV
tara:strand:- start:1331 stop:1444 length:114 start_codon:yes stop_codon:yes gene_type:complete